MKPVEFKGQNVVFAKDQPEYNPLPALKIDGNEGMTITCWEMTEEEFEEVKKTRRIYLSQLTFNQPLQPLMVQSGLDGFFEIEENHE